MKYMKQKRFLGCMLSVCILVLNASEWEGSIWEGNAVVASQGDLPAEGLYVATNVFPRNTVVYITNLETEKTIPVTVAASLNNPGLLVALTREAAQAIGLPIGALGRIKMIQPSDPEAFSQYLAQIAQNTEGAPSDAALQSSGPKEGSAESTLPEKPAPASGTPIGSASQDAAPPEEASPKDAIGIPDAYKPGTPAEFRADEGSPPEPELLVFPGAEPGASGTNQPEISPFPETAEEPRVSIAEKPEERLEQTETYWPGAVISKEPEPGAGEEASGREPGEAGPLGLLSQEQPAGETGASGSSTDIPDVHHPQALPPDGSDKGAVSIQEKPALEDSVVTPETHLPLPASPLAREEAPLTILEKPNPEAVAQAEETGPLEGPRYNTEAYRLRLTPAEERPPAEQGTITLPAEAEIAPIARPAQSEPGIDPNAIIDAIALPVEEAPADREVAPVIPSIPPPAQSAISPREFSVPVISRLERGKYYLQLGAYHQAELVEPELSKIGGAYPLAVEHSGSPDEPLYRILLGPINLGESGALLQRFKRIGYPDAFVRLGT
ncbi:MAG: SPOR domain-containing protein [Treponema sp.]|jgi:hypothetical protein|nr:SPOR domain-containing protein [Treponema sp.]